MGDVEVRACVVRFVSKRRPFNFYILSTQATTSRWHWLLPHRQHLPALVPRGQDLPARLQRLLGRVAHARGRRLKLPRTRIDARVRDLVHDLFHTVSWSIRARWSTRTRRATASRRCSPSSTGSSARPRRRRRCCGAGRRARRAGCAARARRGRRDRDATLAVPREALAAALDAALDAGDAQAGLRARRVCAGRRRARRRAGARAAAAAGRRRGGAPAAALLRRGAPPASTSRTSVRAPTRARSCSRRAPRATSSSRMAARHRLFYGGDGLPRGNPALVRWQQVGDMSHLIDFLRLYDDVSQNGDGIEQLACELYARRMAQWCLRGWAGGGPAGGDRLEARPQHRWRPCGNQISLQAPHAIDGLHAGRGRARAQGAARPV